MMGLNDLSESQAQGLESLMRPHLGPGASHLARHRAHLVVGLLALHRGDLDALCDHLAESARTGVADLAGRAGPGASTGDPIELELPILLACSFGDAETRQAAAGLPDLPWFAPRQWHPDLPTLAGTLDLLRRLAAGQGLDRERLALLMRRASSIDCEERPYPWIAPMLRGLDALARRDRAALGLELGVLVRFHEREARSGEWRERPEGLLALWALALCRLAMAQGLKVRLDSPYLPQALIEPQPAPAISGLPGAPHGLS